MPQRFKAFNGAMPTTGLTAGVATGTGAKTMLQIAPPSGRRLLVRAWGISFDAAASAAGVKAELCQTDVAATVTAHLSTGIMAVDQDGVSLASAVTLGTTNTGFTASAEGSVTAVRVFDVQYVSPAGGYSYQWALGDEPSVEASKFLRIRVNAPATVNALCWVQWEE